MQANKIIMIIRYAIVAISTVVFIFPVLFAAFIFFTSENNKLYLYKLASASNIYLEEKQLVYDHNVIKNINGSVYEIPYSMIESCSLLKIDSYSEKERTKVYIIADKENYDNYINGNNFIYNSSCSSDIEAYNHKIGCNISDIRNYKHRMNGHFYIAINNIPNNSGKYLNLFLESIANNRNISFGLDVAAMC